MTKTSRDLILRARELAESHCRQCGSWDNGSKKQRIFCQTCDPIYFSLPTELCDALERELDENIKLTGIVNELKHLIVDYNEQVTRIMKEDKC